MAKDKMPKYVAVDKLPVYHKDTAEYGPSGKRVSTGERVYTRSDVSCHNYPEQSVCKAAYDRANRPTTNSKPK